MNDFVLSTDILTEFEFESQESYEVRAIVLLVENKRFKEAYNLPLLGRTMKKWVRLAVKNFKCQYVSLGQSNNPLEVIKPFIKDEDYTIVLFSDTPTITEGSILEALDYATTKKLDYCKLPRGFIINAKNFLNGKMENSAEPTFINSSEYFSFFDAKTLCDCKKILQDRIIETHLKNNVIIHDKTSTYIECDVEIAPYVEIYPFNSLRGKTKIEDNVILYEYNQITNSRISSDNNLMSCCIENYDMKAGSNLPPFQVLRGEVPPEYFLEDDEEED